MRKRKETSQQVIIKVYSSVQLMGTKGVIQESEEGRR
jgi:hypothetical protein